MFFCKKGGTELNDRWTAAATASDGSIVLAGYTSGNRTGTKDAADDGGPELAVMAIDGKGQQLWSYQVIEWRMIRCEIKWGRTRFIRSAIFL